MKFRGLLLGAILLAGLAGLVFWSNRAEKAREDKPPEGASPKIVSVSEEDIRRIEISRAGAEATVLEKSDDGVWGIVAPQPLRADQDAVRSLVTSLSSLNSDRLIEEKAGDLTTFGLDAASLTVSFFKADGTSSALKIGSETPTGGGFYAMLEGAPSVYTVASWTKSGLDKTAADLRDKRLVAFDSEKLSRLELTAGGETVEIGRNAAKQWQILRPKPYRADGGEVESLISRLRDARMESEPTPEEARKAAAAFASAKPVVVVRVTDLAGTQQLELRKSKDNDYYARGSTVEGVHKLSSHVGDGLGKTLEDLRNRKLYDFEWDPPTRIEIRDGGQRTVFEKREDKWLRGGKTLDAASMNSFIDNLRDLTALKFKEQGFGEVEFEASVTSDAGKRVEKVQFSKSGENFLARRDGEPSLYEIDAHAVVTLRQAVKDVKEQEATTQEGKKK